MATKIEIELLTEIKDAIKGLHQFQSEANKTFKEVEQSVEGTNKQLGSFSTSLKRTFEVAGGFLLAKVFQEAAEFIKDAASQVVDAAIEQEEAINRLNVSLAVNGRFSEAASKDIQDFANSLQSATGIADDAILNVAALLETITDLDQEGLKTATKATADFATAFRLDLDSAARIVGKAISGNTEALKKYGIEVKKGSNETETFANVLDALGRASGGAAEAATRTFAGSLSLLKAQFGEVLETVGQFIIENAAIREAFKAGAQALIVLNEALIKAKPSMEALITLIAELSSSILVSLIDATTTVVSFLDTLTKLASASNGASDAFRLLGLTLKKFFFAFLLETNELLISFFDLLGKIPGLAGVASNAIQNIRSSNIKDLNKSLGQTEVAIKELERSTKDLDRTEKNRAKDSSSGLRNQQRDLQELQKEIKKTEGAFGEAFKKAVVAIQFVADDSGEAAGKKTGKQFGGTFLSTFVDGFFPGLGKFISDFISSLSGKSQEAATEFIQGFRKGFADSVGELATAIIRGIIGTISSKAISDTDKANVIGSIVEEIVAALPDLFEAIATSIVQVLTEGTLGFKIAVAIVRGLIRGLERVGPEGFEGVGTRVIKALFEKIFGTDLDEAVASIDWSKLINGFLAAFAPLFAAILNTVNQIVGIFKGGPIEAFKASLANAGKVFQTSIAQAGQGFAGSVIAGAEGFVQKLIEGVTGAFPSISAPSLPGVGSLPGGGGGFSLPNLPFFADGGRVPDLAQFKNDGLVARVSAGEQILSEDLSSKLDDFLKGSSAPQPVTVNLRLGESEIARVLLNLNRQGFRTT